MAEYPAATSVPAFDTPIPACARAPAKAGPTPQGLGVCLVLLVAALCWSALPGHHGQHLVVMMAMIALASVIGSLAGFAFSAVCGAMLFHLHDDPVTIVQVMITCSIANQASMTFTLRRDIDWPALLPFLAGGILGLVPGIWALLYLDRTLYTYAFGTFLAAYGIYMSCRRPIVIRGQRRAIDVATGFLGGVTGGAAGFPSAFIAIWCGMRGWEKTRQRATLQPYILIMQLVALPAITLARHAGTGLPHLDLVDSLFIPASLLGTWIGMALYRRLTDRNFARAVSLMMIVSGLSYLL